ncbi:MAG: fumarate hydratase [Nitrospirae bacterium]|nr:MAG: fumarate hydratase [Nitrospirota bacterium]
MNVLKGLITSGKFSDAVLHLIRTTSTELPDDVVSALRRAHEDEAEGSTAKLILERYLENLHLAEERAAPICQDTGMPIFYIHSKGGCTMQKEVTTEIEQALRMATERQYLRPNAVDPLTGENSGDNTGRGFPPVYFYETTSDQITIDLILKGGGSENVSAQYSLPHAELGAGRDFEGVRRVVLDAVVKAAGKGCPPGILGISIGGDRESGYREAKKQLLRPLDDKNPDALLGELETRLYRDVNELGIGPQGLGGKTTVLGVKVTALHRLPACYFVTVSYMCWAMRRRKLVIEQNGEFRVV